MRAIIKFKFLSSTSRGERALQVTFFESNFLLTADVCLQFESPQKG